MAGRGAIRGRRADLVAVGRVAHDFDQVAFYGLGGPRRSRRVRRAIGLLGRPRSGSSVPSRSPRWRTTRYIDLSPPKRNCAEERWATRSRGRATGDAIQVGHRGILVARWWTGGGPRDSARPPGARPRRLRTGLRAAAAVSRAGVTRSGRGTVDDGGRTGLDRGPVRTLAIVSEAAAPVLPAQHSRMSSCRLPPRASALDRHFKSRRGQAINRTRTTALSGSPAMLEPVALAAAVAVHGATPTSAPAPLRLIPGGY